METAEPLILRERNIEDALSLEKAEGYSMLLIYYLLTNIYMALFLAKCQMNGIKRL